ncbi:MAG: NUDIX hydrolase [Patescibacteria group bacterium]|jgi:ADP-ribose pyrophosphatase YjhB (NUDIX family)
MENNITLQVGVKALLKNKEGQYLLIRRSLIKYPDIKGRWDIVGGRIEPGTTLLENLRREIKEETNLELVNTPQLIAAQDIIPKVDKHIVRLTYIGEISGEIKLDESENDMYKWYSSDELKQVADMDIYFKELLDNNYIII